MVEQGTSGDPRKMPGIEGKHKVEDPLALSIRDMKRKLGLRFRHLPQERGSLSAERRLLANAVILIDDFNSRFFEDESFVEKERSDQAWRKKKIDEGDFVDKRNKDAITEEYEKYEADAAYKKKLRKGEIKERGEVLSHITDTQTRILFSLRIVPEINEIFRSESNPTLTVEELICLSVVHKRQKPEVRDKAISYLMHSEGLGGIVLDQLKKYLLNIDRGYLAAIFNDKHATPLRNGEI